MYNLGNIATSSNDSDLRDGGVLDVDVDQGEVLPGVTVHQVDQLGVAAERKMKDQMHIDQMDHT